MEQASGSFMPDIRAFSVHLPLISLFYDCGSLLLFGSWSINIIFITILSGEYRWLVLSGLYSRYLGWMVVLFVLFHPSPMYLPLPRSPR